MSGHYGYRPTADFVRRHQPVLLALLGFDHPRLPSLSTLRRVMVHIDFSALTAAVNAWLAETSATGHLAIDGKSIKASLQDYDQSYQDFVNVVSVFSVTRAEVVALLPMQNQQGSEIKTVQRLLEHLQLTGVCFSLDALHTQKNRAANYCHR